MDDSDDPRDIELSSLSAIYPEIQFDPTNQRSFSLELPVNPSKAIQVFFPAPAAPPGSGTSVNVDPSRPQAQGVVGERDDRIGAALEESHELSYLPSVRLQIALPEGYPTERAPQVSVSATPSWIPASRIAQLEAECGRLWEEFGRDAVVFSYIDYIQQSAEGVFGVVDENGVLKVDLQHKIAVLDYDISARRAAFERETFDCGICLDPKKGSVCHRMLGCDHVFCAKCLQDFYNNAIKEGDVSSVRCLSPNCSKERENTVAAVGSKKKRKPKLIIPSELLQIPLEPDVVKRYVNLRYKMELESDKNTIYCPRPWCHGAARSKKHKKPKGLEFVEGSDDSGDENEENAGAGAGNDGQDTPRKRASDYKRGDYLLAICEDCGFAFCSRCHQSWHGEFVLCFPPRDDKELTAEEKASLEYLDLHTTPCPTCAAPAQKTHGCNHMICGRQGCGTHFCYLCSAWLDPSNPYSHYNKEQPGGPVTGCFGRLWELEEGDGADIGLEFAGGERRRERVRERHPDPPAAALVPEVPIPEIEEPDDDAPRQQQPREGDEDANPGRVALEAPLVLRIAADPAARGPPPPPAAPVPPPAAGPGQRQQQRNQNQAGGRQQPQRQRNQRGRGGGGAGGNNAAAGRGRGARPRGGAGAGAGARQAPDANAEVPRQVPDVNVEGELNEAQRAWVQQFVQLALNDEEDQLDSDSEDEEEMVFWIR